MVVVVILQQGRADTFDTTIEAPNFDRWMYPFNGSIGDREVASTFSSIGGGYEIFDDRDGQILLGFITPDDIPVGLGATNYYIVEATLHISVSNDGNIYDPTSDPWQSYLAQDAQEDEECMTCDGTGKRDDEHVKGKCNGCEGKGTRRPNKSCKTT